MNKIIIGILVVIAAFIAVLAIVLAMIPYGNNRILDKYTEELRNFELNADYEILATGSQCGKLRGNGNGMQYFSALLIRSEEELIWENSDMEGIFLVPADDASIDMLMSEYHGYYDKNIQNQQEKLKSTENCYVMYSFYNADMGSIWECDLRAH